MQKPYKGLQGPQLTFVFSNTGQIIMARYTVAERIEIVEIHCKNNESITIFCALCEIYTEHNQLTICN